MPTETIDDVNLKKLHFAQRLKLACTEASRPPPHFYNGGSDIVKMLKTDYIFPGRLKLDRNPDYDDAPLHIGGGELIVAYSYPNHSRMMQFDPHIRIFPYGVFQIQ